MMEGSNENSLSKFMLKNSRSFEDEYDLKFVGIENRFKTKHQMEFTFIVLRELLKHNICNQKHLIYVLETDQKNFNKVMVNMQSLQLVDLRIKTNEFEYRITKKGEFVYTKLKEFIEMYSFLNKGLYEK